MVVETTHGDRYDAPARLEPVPKTIFGSAQVLTIEQCFFCARGAGRLENSHSNAAAGVLSASVPVAAGVNARLRMLYALFFVSGFSSLIYQVVWQRLLTLYYGVGPVTVAIVVSVFMAGLGLGALAGGRIVERVSRLVGVYVAIEGCIGLFGLASIPLLHAIGTLTAGASYPVVLAVSFLYLLFPTLLMGATLPLLVRLTHDIRDEFYGNLSQLYFINTLGAASGAAISAFVFITLLGLDGATYIAVALNIALAATVYVIRRTVSAAPAARPTAREVTAWQYVALSFVTGFVAIGLEMAWFRVIAAIVKSTSYVFAAVLSIYLLGIAIGSYIGPRYTKRFAGRERQLFLLLNAGVGITSFVLFMALYLGLRWTPLFALGEASARYIPSPYLPVAPVNGGQILASLGSWLSMFAYPAVLILIPTILMGASFPLMASLAYRGSGAGRTAGTIYFGNTLGNVAGGLLTTFLLFPVLGTVGTIIGLAAVSVGFLAFCDGFLSQPWRATIVVAALAVLIGAFPYRDGFYHLMYVLSARSPANDGEFLDLEGAGGHSTLYLHHGEIENSMTGTLNGHFPSPALYRYAISTMAYSNQARNVFVVGIGGGNFSAVPLLDPRVSHMTVVELQETLVRNWMRIANGPSWLRDKRTEIVVDDGRRLLLRDRRKWDVVFMDPIRRQFSYAGNIFSTDFFSIAAGRMSDDGILATRSQGDIQARTLASVFPYVDELDCGMLIASKRPLNYRRDRETALLAAIPDPSFRREVSTVECSVARDRNAIMAQTAYLPISSDYRPYGEYFLGVDLKALLHGRRADGVATH